MPKNFEICQDRDGYPIGVGFFVRIDPRPRVENEDGKEVPDPADNRKPWNAWVLGWDPDKEVLILEDAKRAFRRYASTTIATVVPASTMDKARRVGHEKSIRATSEHSKKALRIRSGVRKTP